MAVRKDAEEQGIPLGSRVIVRFNSKWGIVQSIAQHRSGSNSIYSVEYALDSGQITQGWFSEDELETA